MNEAELQQELEALTKKLADPSIFSNPDEYQQIAKRYGELKSMLANKTRGLDSKGEEVIIEIRAGAGGDEATLFAHELYRMYSKYAERMGWKTKILNSNRTELKGIKEISFELSGKEALKHFEGEGGVHRVQRIPETEKSGRIHTSTVSVAVLPKAKPIDIEIRPEDIKVDTYRSSGPGGQNVNKVSSAIRITHLPTGMVISSQESRSQQENRELAMTLLRSRLLQQKQMAEAEARGELRKQQIGSAERSEKIRTYNFPQDRVTDHRLQKSWSNIKDIMEGSMPWLRENVR